MRTVRFASAFAGAWLSIAGMSTAVAADLMPAKAVPKATPWVLDVHGFFDLNFATSRVTGSGLLLYPTSSALLQPSAGLSLDVYKDPSGFINSFTLFGGIWNETWLDAPVGVRHWTEMDWWGGFKVGFARYWAFTGEFVQFVFPGGGSVSNISATLSFDDSSFWPIAFRPYVQVWYVADGGPAVPLGETHGTRVTFGVAPTVTPFAPIPLSFTFPIAVTVSSSDFWNRNDGTTNFCGTTNLAPCETSSLGFVTAGIQAKYLLTDIIPKRLGTWYVRAGVQYYHIANDALMAGQAATTPGGTGVVANFSSAKEDIFIGSGGVGFSF